MTNRLETWDSVVMMSSVMPSEKYSWSGSPLILANGRTAIDGLSGIFGPSAPDGSASMPPCCTVSSFIR